MSNYTTTIDFILDLNDIKKLKKYILKSSNSKSFLNNKLNKSLIIKTSIYTSLLFFMLLLLKAYLFIGGSSMFSINYLIYNIAAFIEIIFKIFIVFISSFFIFSYLNRINNSYLISSEIEKLNLFLGENHLYLSKKDIKISNNKIELLFSFSGIDNISLYKEYIFFSNNQKLLFVIKCADKTLKRTISIDLEENFKKQILIKEI